MKMIIGLGNPGAKYQKTRHNLGFLVIEEIRKHFGLPPFSFNKKFEAEICKSELNGEKVILAKPQTFMNLSGRAVKKIIDFYKLKKDDFLIILDDIDLDFGKIRIREKGSAGGHKGLESIIKEISNQNFFRIRVGIKNKIGERETEKYVLENFRKKEMEIIKEKIFPLLKKTIKDFLKGEVKNKTISLKEN